MRINPADGQLTLVQTFAAYTNPPRMRVALHPSGRFMYVLMGGEPGRDFWTGAIMTLAVDAQTGQLTKVGVTDDMGFNSQAFALHPSGRFLYVNNSGHYNTSSISPKVWGSVTTMVIDPVSGLPSRLLPDFDNPHLGAYCASVDPTGTYLYADATLTGNAGATMRQFRIDATTGRLTWVRDLGERLQCPRYRESG
ncbi:lactonase family protein [Roseateles sp. L2-2]|uniref:lactonase family protein n=1 Tax=Roseateles sp. L2-2 TaxID=3422597 RepID=UPI003D367151